MAKSILSYQCDVTELGVGESCHNWGRNQGTAAHHGTVRSTLQPRLASLKVLWQHEASQHISAQPYSDLTPVSPSSIRALPWPFLSPLKALPSLCSAHFSAPRILNSHGISCLESNCVFPVVRTQTLMGPLLSPSVPSKAGRHTERAQHHSHRFSFEINQTVPLPGCGPRVFTLFF